MPVNEIIRCRVLGVGSVNLGDVQTNRTGREIWTGIRLRTDAGQTRFVKSLLVEAEAALIVREAMDRGDLIEFWLTGKDERAYVYGMRCGTEEWYYDGFSKHLNGRAIQFLLFGLLLLPALGIGIFFIIPAVGFFSSASTFAARHSRQTFLLGYEAGVLGKAPDGHPEPVRQAA